MPLNFFKKIISIFDQDTIIHLRFPFSFFLLPVFCFALSQAISVDMFHAVVIFIALHLFIYPGSNIYNSYMDRDKGSIGGIRNPPPVTKKLFHASILFDIAGLMLCLLIHPLLAGMMIVYVAVSKAYSWHGIRLKKHAFTGWLIVMVFQGAYTYLLVSMSIENEFDLQWFNLKNLQAMIIASAIIGGFYPITQIYQHEEDRDRGDITISYRLGVQGTFFFAAAWFILSGFVAYIYFLRFYNNLHFFVFILCLVPATYYFLHWYLKTMRDKTYADYTHSMRMVSISSICTILCYGVLFYLNH